MSETSGISKAVERYNPFNDDYSASRSLLNWIQSTHYDELRESGFATRFLDAIGTVPNLNPNAIIVFKQDIEGGVRHINAVLRQWKDDGTLDAYTVAVGHVKDDLRYVRKIFHDEDLEIGLKQLDGLQVMRDLGMVTIDRTLSYPDWVDANSFLK